jgi:hypothetical protein
MCTYDAGSAFAQRLIANASPSPDGQGYCCPAILTPGVCGCEQSLGGFAASRCDCAERVAECLRRATLDVRDEHGCDTVRVLDRCGPSP